MLRIWVSAALCRRCSSASAVPWCSPHVAGIYSGAVYNDPTLRGAGFSGEGHIGPDVIVVKSHLDNAPTLANGRLRHFNKVIHLMRNPFQALVAERKRLVAGTMTFWNSHVFTPPLNAFLEGREYTGSNQDPYAKTAVLPWKEWALTVGLPKWVNTTRLGRAWIDNDVLPVMTLRFEDLVRNTQREMKKALRFIGEPGSQLAPKLPIPCLVVDGRDGRNWRWISRLCFIRMHFFVVQPDGGCCVLRAMSSITHHHDPAPQALHAARVAADANPAAAECLVTESVSMRRTPTEYAQTITTRFRSPRAGTLTPTVVPYEQYPDCLYDKSMIELITHSAQQELKLYGYQPPITC